MSDLSDYEPMEIGSTPCDTLDENGHLVICDSLDDGMPSKTFGIAFFGAIFAAFIVTSLLLTMVLMCCSKKQEQARRNTLAARRETQRASIQLALDCKPWCDGVESVASGSEQTDKTLSLRSYDSTFAENSELPSEPQSSLRLSVSPFGSPDTRPTGQKGGSVCALCSESFELGQPVYQSNNPQCRHWHRKQCMDKWLAIQNSCPVCNEPYALQTV